MALFTGRGDDGTTKTYGAKERMSKGSPVAEALGTLDEVNSFLGLCKVHSEKLGYATASGMPFRDIVHSLQGTLFVVQSELAGSDMTVSEDRAKELSELVNAIEAELPPIQTFFISGGTELAAMFDVARTLARRAERRVVGVKDSGERIIGSGSLAFLNRLSSVLYALARLSNHRAGIKDVPPDYDGKKVDPGAPGERNPNPQ